MQRQFSSDNKENHFTHNSNNDTQKYSVKRCSKYANEVTPIKLNPLPLLPTPLYPPLKPQQQQRESHPPQRIPLLDIEKKQWLQSIKREDGYHINENSDQYKSPSKGLPFQKPLQVLNRKALKCMEVVDLTLSPPANPTKKVKVRVTPIKVSSPYRYTTPVKNPKTKSPQTKKEEVKVRVTPIKVSSPYRYTTPVKNPKTKSPKTNPPQTTNVTVEQLNILKDLCASLNEQLNYAEKISKQTQETYKAYTEKQKFSQQNVDSYTTRTTPTIPSENVNQSQSTSTRSQTVTRNNTQNNITQKNTHNKADPNLVKIGKITFCKKDILDKPSDHTTIYKGLWDNCVDVVVKQTPKESGLKEKLNYQKLQKHHSSEFLLKYIDYEEDENFVYIALELCDTNLEKLVKGKYDPKKEKENYDFDCKILFQDIVLGLDYLHKNELVHGNLHPRNILIKTHHWTKKLRAKIASFNTLGSVDRQTFYKLCNKDEYFTSPEIVDEKRKDEKITKKTEIFIAGILFYYLLTKGEHPFGSESSCIQLRITEGRYRMSTLIKEDAESLLTWMLRKDPNDRPTASKVLCHPFFWDISKKEIFLEEVMRGIKIFRKNNFFDERDLDFTEDGAYFFRSGSWTNLIDPGVMEGSKYNPNSVFDFLRLIRNVRHHYDTRALHIRHKLLNAPTGILPYFLTKCPEIVSHVYFKLLRNKKLLNFENGKLWKYFE